MSRDLLRHITKSFKVSLTEANSDEQERYPWPTAEGMSATKLLKHLCSMGRLSYGKDCVNCESQCAFGRKFAEAKGIV
jgi:hypothetical protein